MSNIIENPVSHIVPSQKKGNHTGAKAHLKTASVDEAIKLFGQAKHRLLDINSWQKISGKGSAEFRLTDKNGHVLKSNRPRVGNLIRIKLPAPGNKLGSGYDWVRIEVFKHVKDILKDEEVYGFRVRPIKNPLKQTETSAHFYTSDASSTFLLKRTSEILSVMEIGRNEIPNTHPVSFLNKIRNMIVAFSASLGLAKPQWKKLVKGILNGSVIQIKRKTNFLIINEPVEE
ncbi:MAG: hypothetical protein H7141_06025 [Burkholderiales bacterium]|nr:hypothetical protein [Bacteroidia bacterium]